jgi:hypothetical protein
MKGKRKVTPIARGPLGTRLPNIGFVHGHGPIIPEAANTDLTVIQFRNTIYAMGLDGWSVVFDRHANRHGFSNEQIVDAYLDADRIESYTMEDGTMIKFTGPCPTDALVDSLEAIIKIRPSTRTIVVYHAQSLTDVFWDE